MPTEQLPVIPITPNLASFATPYSVGDVAGGIIEIPQAVSYGGLGAILNSIAVKDKNGQSPAFTILFFKVTPAGGTYTDNSALAFGSSDVANICGVVKVKATDYYARAGASIAHNSAIGQGMEGTATSLFMLIIVDSAWTAASASDLTLELGFERKQ